MLGIDGLKREVRDLKVTVNTLINAVVRLQETIEAIIGTNGPPLRTTLAAIQQTTERIVEEMPTRDEFDAAKQQLAQAINDATTRVTTDIQTLRDQLAKGNPITDQDLADLQADIAAVSQIDPAVTPSP
jgi:hypothetical protein